MTLQKTPLTEAEQTVLLLRLKEYQPDHTEEDARALLRWAENVRTAQGLLEILEAGEVKFSVRNGKVTVHKRKS